MSDFEFKKELTLGDAIQAGGLLIATIALFITTAGIRSAQDQTEESIESAGEQTQQTIQSAQQLTNRELRASVYAKYLSAEREYLEAQRDVANVLWDKQIACLEATAARESVRCRRPLKQGRVLEAASVELSVALQQVLFIGTRSTSRALLKTQQALRHRVFPGNQIRLSPWVARRTIALRGGLNPSSSVLARRRHTVLERMSCDINQKIWWSTDVGAQPGTANQC